MKLSAPPLEGFYNIIVKPKSVLSKPVSITIMAFQKLYIFRENRLHFNTLSFLDLLADKQSDNISHPIHSR